MSERAHGTSGLIDPSDDLARQNAKLRRITDVLMNRVERNTERTGDAFSLFQRAIALEGEVQARTRELNRTLEQLNRANVQLAAASAAAEEANRAKSRFVAAASHDVRQPLTAAKLFLEQMGRTDVDSQQEALVEQLNSAFRSVESILGSLLDISRLDSSATRAEIKGFPVAHVLQPVIEEFLPFAVRNGIDLWCVPSSEWIESDPFYLRQIVQNLVSNAVKYCGAGRVLIGCRRRGDRLEIEVHDTGPGLTDAEREVIFTEFKRLPQKTRYADQVEGVGLGLAIVERASRLLEHPLDLRSRPGQGSVFSVSVPLCAPLPSGESATKPEEDDLAGDRIVLVLSADPSLGQQIMTRLDRWDMAGMLATSVEEAERHVAQLGMAPDAVLIDQAGLSAEQVAQAARLYPGSTRRVILADGSGTDEASDPLIAGDVYLRHPLRPHRLRAALS